MPAKPKTSRHEHSAEVLRLAFRLHDREYSCPQIAATLELPRSTVYRIIKDREKHQERIQTGSKRPGRKPKLTKRAERLLLRHVNNNPRDTLVALSSPQNRVNNFTRALCDGTLPKTTPHVSTGYGEIWGCYLAG
jgi:hypothetical protein